LSLRAKRSSLITDSICACNFRWASKHYINVDFKHEASAYQPGCFFFRVGSELAFAFGKPSLRSTTCLPSWRKLHKRFLRKSQAYEKAIPSSRLAVFKQELLNQSTHRIKAMLG